MVRTIFIASRNRGKIAEVEQILHDLPVRFLSFADIEGAPKTEEDGTSFAENARKKAVAGARFAGEWTLADDSGLEVDALGGRPGVHSSRWSGGGDEANNDKLLADLRDVPPPARTARYRAHIVVAEPSGRIVAEAEGACEGLIGFERRGTSGFGYDPLFVVPEYGRTMAELGLEIKNRISHRARALDALREPVVRELGV
ncbi:MAG: RdgB/HAM1 family non-canonical purine NTP pyrophosphatase [Planctomycetes bacterium]|nr:RdgB/HAM1 family non-canonical purine NTP pyrophosphatase [Planctomycetota bacterium]